MADNKKHYAAYKKRLSAMSITAAVTCTMHAQAQEEIEEISVTGSRIRMTSGMATPVRVTVATMDELAAVNPGDSTVEQMAQLPQFLNTQSSRRGSGTFFDTAGGSYRNMRNLGSKRTLILLDGSRLPLADRRGSVNVDMMPTALMRSVDTVTGASAAHGADAPGGDVNFIPDREFQGLFLVCVEREPDDIAQRNGTERQHANGTKSLIPSRASDIRGIWNKRLNTSSRLMIWLPITTCIF